MNTEHCELCNEEFDATEAVEFVDPWCCKHCQPPVEE